MMGVAVNGVIFRKFPLEHAVLAKADAKGADPQFGFRAFQRPERNPFTACGGLHLLRGRRAFAQEAPQEPLGVLSGRAFPSDSASARTSRAVPSTASPHKTREANMEYSESSICSRL